MLKNWIVSIVVNAIALYAVAVLLNAIEIDGFAMALLAGLILSILNVIVRPILVVLTLPITMITLGLFLFVVNAITLLLTAWMMGSSFVIDGFGWAILAAIIITILNTLLESLFKNVVS
ncbi:phage holin family protein [Halalkalibacillus halophilus]|uniref:phage holin family protein n=1 Tax=Halalkalibacillus halophilus TaxID=392827 RepID=UPI0003FF68B5|nr:phage holin family protein [Halalkalibacillus halophilus]